MTNNDEAVAIEPAVTVTVTVTVTEPDEAEAKRLRKLQRTREWRAAHPEQCRLNQKKWREAHPNYYRDNYREYQRVSVQKWREAHPEHRLSHRLYQQRYTKRHKEEIAERAKQRLATDLEYKEREKAKSAKYYRNPVHRHRILQRLKENYVRVYGDDEESVERRKEKNRKNIKIAIAKGTILKRAQMEQRKSEFLKLLDENIGIVTTVCIKQGITRETYYRWLRNDLEFADKVQEIKDRGVDFAEDMLMSKVVSGDLQAIMFFLRGQGKHRGWNDKIDVSVATNTNAVSADRLIDSLDEETRNRLVSAYKQVRDESRSSLVLPSASETIDVEVKPKN